MIIENPYTIILTQTVHEAINLCEEKEVSGSFVTDNQGQLGWNIDMKRYCDA